MSEKSIMLTAKELAQMIDHTLLKADATPAQIAQLCAEATTYQFAAVCVNPVNVAQAAKLLRDTEVAVCTVVGFPLGATLSAVKAYETVQVIAAGATEIDMVINIGALKAGQHEPVQKDIAAVTRTAHEHGATVKVIIETALLTDAEKRLACELAQASGADYVKTSTGFAAGGATAADVTLMRQTVGPYIGVKAAGGIRTLADAQAMVAAGATRLGTSAGITIMREMGL